jgi:alkylhydroperoxidase family enzyme
MDSVPAVGRRKNLVTDEEIREIPNWAHSKILGERDKTAIEYAEEISKTPVRVSDELFGRLQKYFSDDQIVELTASVAYENYRARFNHALHIGSENLYS